MAPAATENETVDQTILTLRKVLVNESEPLARRFRALFSLKHVACLQPPTEQTLPAIQAIAAGFTSKSALLKHELAYCLGQTLNRDSVSYLQHVVKDVEEDAMCRHEAAEALGALGYDDSLDLLKKLRDDENELEIVRETCDIAVDRIVWENSEERKAEKLKPRYDRHLNETFTSYVSSTGTENVMQCFSDLTDNSISLVTSPPSTLLPQCPSKPVSPASPTWRRPSSTPHFLSSKDTAQCSVSATSLLPPTFQPPLTPSMRWPRVSMIPLLCSVTRSPLSLANSATLPPFLA